MKKKMISVLLTAGLLAGTLAGNCVTVPAEEKASDKIAIGALKGTNCHGHGTAAG